MSKKEKKKTLRHSNGEAVQFGGDVVALEKDKIFKRVYVYGEYSMYFFSLLPFLRMLLRDAGFLWSEGRNNQCNCIAASMTMCKYVYLEEHGAPATTNKAHLKVCVFLC